jgi:hypothetical protein
MYISTHTHTHTHTHQTHAHANVCVYLCIAYKQCVGVSACPHTYPHMHNHTHMSFSSHMKAHSHTCMCVSMDASSPTHTHTHALCAAAHLVDCIHVCALLHKHLDHIHMPPRSSPSCSTATAGVASVQQSGAPLSHATHNFSCLQISMIASMVVCVPT